MSEPRLRVIHLGPDRAAISGISSVLRAFEASAPEGVEMDFATTWRPDARLWGLGSWLSTLPVILRLRRSTIAHVHLSDGGSLLREGSLAVLASLRGMAVVATVHAAAFDAWRRHRRIVRFVLRRCRRVVVLNTEAAELMTEFGLDLTVDVLPNPVVPPTDPAPAGDTGPTALFVGYLSERKGIPLLLGAWPAVRERIPDARLVLAGPGRESWEATAPDGAEFVGPVSPTQVRAYLEEARLLTLPSRAEGMPIVVLEALSSARPVVATPLPGIRPLVEGPPAAGVLVGADEASIADGLTCLLRDPVLAQEMGEAGRARVVDLCGVDATRKRLSDLYSQLGDGWTSPKAADARLD